MEIPVDERSRSFYARAAALVNRPDLEAWYRDWLENPPSPDDSAGGGESEVDGGMLGLLELVAVYDSLLRLEESDDSRHIALYLEFPYESEDME